MIDPDDVLKGFDRAAASAMKLAHAIERWKAFARYAEAVDRPDIAAEVREMAEVSELRLQWWIEQLLETPIDNVLRRWRARADQGGS